MAEKKQKKEKKGSMKGLAGILIAIMILILIVALMLYTIFEGIIKIIKEIIIGIIQGLLNFLAHPIKSMIKAYYELSSLLSELFNGDVSHELEKKEGLIEKQLVIIEQDEFNDIKEKLKQTAVDKEIAGLSDAMIKKMLLAYNTGMYSHNADIIIELTHAEKAECEENSPFDVIKGKELEQINMNFFEEKGESFATWVNSWGADAETKEKLKQELNEKKAMEDRDYLYAKGTLIFLNEYGEEMTYWNEETLDKLYKKYQDNKDNLATGVQSERSDYAESIWKYISTRAYTDSSSGIKVYTKVTTREQVINWEYADTNVTKKISRLIRANITESREAEHLDLSLISQFTTPVEFMVDLLNISSSKEFVDAFIKKAAEETEITLQIHKTGKYSEEEAVDDIKETTSVKGEINITGEVYQINYLDDTKWYDSSEGDVKITLWSDTAFAGIGEQLKIRVRVSNYDKYGGKKDSKAEKVKIKLYWSGRKQQEIQINNLDSGNRTWENSAISGWGLTRYVTRENECEIKKTTTTATTEIKADMSIVKAKTWYADKEYKSEISTERTFETKDAVDGTKREISMPIPAKISYGNRSAYYGVNDSGMSGVFNTNGSVDGLIVDELANDFENWYAGLKSNDLGFWMMRRSCGSFN